MDKDITDLKFQSYTLLVLVFVVQELKILFKCCDSRTWTEKKLMIFLKHTLSRGWDVFLNQVIYRFQRKDISRCKMQCVFPTFGFASSAFPLPAFIPPNVSTAGFI